MEVNFKWPSNREDRSDFDDFGMEFGRVEEIYHFETFSAPFRWFSDGFEKFFPLVSKSLFPSRIRSVVKFLMAK